MTSTLDVSVVVCSYNRAEMLRTAVASLFGLRVPSGVEIEIVVVDNASSDTTSTVIAELSSRSPFPFRGVYEGKPGVAAARNRGIAEARGRWIAFFDDDQVADSGWLAELLAMAREKRIRCVGGAVRLLLPEGTPEMPDACRKIFGESVGMDEPLEYGRKRMPGTGNLLVHTDVFAEVGHFDESLRQAGEDSDLFLRIFQAGIAAWYTPSAIVRHVIPEYRVGAEYLRWVFQRNGWVTAQREQSQHGGARLIAIVAARLLQAGLLHTPALVWARLRGNKADELGRRCLLWRAQGYARGTLSFLAPKTFSQQKYSAYLEFRGERQMLGAEAPVTEELLEAVR